jgi:hypothetical protein
MRKILIPALMLSTVVAIAPASAQYGRGHRGNHVEWNRGGPSRQAINPLRLDLQRVESRIQRSQQRRIISPREAISLRREAHQIERRLNMAGRDGLSGREFASLRAEVNRLQQRLRLERNDRDGRRY